VTICRR